MRFHFIINWIDDSAKLKWRTILWWVWKSGREINFWEMCEGIMISGSIWQKSISGTRHIRCARRARWCQMDGVFLMSYLGLSAQGKKYRGRCSYRPCLPVGRNLILWSQLALGVGRHYWWPSPFFSNSSWQSCNELQDHHYFSTQETTDNPQEWL